MNMDLVHLRWNNLLLSFTLIVQANTLFPAQHQHFPLYCFSLTIIHILTQAKMNKKHLFPTAQMVVVSCWSLDGHISEYKYV